jgi:hypothetical protein
MASHATTEALTAPAETAAGARGRVKAIWVVVGVVWFAAALVFWLFDALPFMDLPAHAGLIALRHRFEESAFEQDYFVLAANLGPYSLFRFLGEGFLRLLGPLGAVRALATLPLIVTPLALFFARKRLHGDASPSSLFFGIALSFGLMTILGFASYLLGLAVLVIVLTIWLELLADVDAQRATGKRELAVVFAAIFLFVAHGHAFVLGIGLMAITALASPNFRARVLRFRALVPSLAVAGYAALITRMNPVPTGSVAVPNARMNPMYESPLEKLGLLLTPTMTTRIGLDVVAGCIIWFVVGIAAVQTATALVRGRAASVPAESRAHSRSLLVAAIAIALVFLALPHTIGWFGFVDGRLVPLILFLLLVALQRPLARAVEPSLDVAAPFAAILIVALALVSSYRFQAEARGYKDVLAHVPAQARLLNLPVDPNSDVFTAHPFVHYDKLVLADRPIVVSDVWFHQGTALFPTERNPALRLPKSYSESNLRRVDWPQYRLEDWNYILIRTRPEGAPGPVPDSLELEAHEGGWWLFHVRPNGHETK